MKEKTWIGILLAVVGLWILLPIIGVTIGWLFSLLFPLLLIGIGVVGWRNNSKVIGGAFLAVGAVLLLAKLSKILFLILAVLLVLWGVSLLTGKRY
ncbi:hypothetical protein ACFOQM_02560 [Paenibacillus sp. GCM10012307]|uniref:LiaF transmembrane domain-containing protein n=1 Tax=Paenibacillus roseus TaxID=2798579 RepID=A0A934J2E2_9BACL|nr:hypothetical protein [Paenibacillus roseus]MBJ6360198.1 hypothetical protein [Paenibacillus roseus]